MRALQEEQVLFNKNAHAPYYNLLRELGEDSDVVEEVLRRQIFNWLPGGATEHKCFKLVSKFSRTDVGILWNCTMKGDEVRVHVSWDSAQLNVTEVQELLNQLVRLVEQLGKSESWGKFIGDLV